ncbi:MAG: RNA-directed DNA polymerase [Syntrophobacteraceae bacterium]
MYRKFIEMAKLLNIYLNPLDHFIKRKLKIEHYVRYVDDMVLIGITRERALECKTSIAKFLRDHLGLELSKSSIQKVKRGINFVGYRTWQSKRFIRKYSLYKFGKKVKSQNISGVVSLLGHAMDTSSLPYMLGYLRSAPNMLNRVPCRYRRLLCSLSAK